MSQLAASPCAANNASSAAPPITISRHGTRSPKDRISSGRLTSTTSSVRRTTRSRSRSWLRRSAINPLSAIALNAVNHAIAKIVTSANTVVVNTWRKPRESNHSRSTSRPSARLSTTKATISAASRPNNRNRGRIEFTRSDAAGDLGDVFTNHVGRAHPDKQFEGQVSDQEPVEFADYRHQIELE